MKSHRAIISLFYFSIVLFSLDCPNNSVSALKRSSWSGFVRESKMFRSVSSFYIFFPCEELSDVVIPYLYVLGLYIVEVILNEVYYAL